MNKKENHITVFRIILASITLFVSFFSMAQSGGSPTPNNAPVTAIPFNRLEPNSYVRWGPNGVNNGIPYSRVTGSPFFIDDWSLTKLFGRTLKEIWLCKTRLNLATGEIHFLNNAGEENVIEMGVIKKMVLYDNEDTSKVNSIFIFSEQVAEVGQFPGNAYLQVLNSGRYQLLKKITRVVTSADSLFGTQKRYYFSSQTQYLISNNVKIEPVKKLKKENILIYLPDSPAYNDWIDQHKIDFKKEKDIVEFLDHYNEEKIN